MLRNKKKLGKTVSALCAIKLFSRKTFSGLQVTGFVICVVEVNFGAEAPLKLVARTPFSTTFVRGPNFRHVHRSSRTSKTIETCERRRLSGVHLRTVLQVPGISGCVCPFQFLSVDEE